MNHTKKMHLEILEQHLTLNGTMTHQYAEKLLKVSRGVARDIFQNAHQHDLNTVGRQRMYYYGRKVSLEAVLAVTGKSFNMLAKQIKSSDSPAK